MEPKNICFNDLNLLVEFNCSAKRVSSDILRKTELGKRVRTYFKRIQLAEFRQKLLKLKIPSLRDLTPQLHTSHFQAIEQVDQNANMLGR